MMWIEIDRGPSKLEMKLEAYKNRETGHITLGPEVAKNILFEALLSAHRASVERPNSTVEVLVQITEAKGEGMIDFTEALEKFENEQAEKERQVRETLKFAGTLPSRPPVREI